jgi:hypothetical protein
VLEGFRTRSESDAHKMTTNGARIPRREKYATPEGVETRDKSARPDMLKSGAGVRPPHVR